MFQWVNCKDVFHHIKSGCVEHYGGGKKEKKKKEEKEGNGEKIKRNGRKPEGGNNGREKKKKKRKNVNGWRWTKDKKARIQCNQSFYSGKQSHREEGCADEQAALRQFPCERSKVPVRFLGENIAHEKDERMF